MNNPITIALADDELLFRQGLKAILGKEKHIKILFDASDGNDLIKQLRSTPALPRIVFMNLKMQGLNGVEATRIIREEFPEIKIIALTGYFNKSFIVNMIRVGAVAYLTKNSTPKLMLTTIKEVAEKGFYYDVQIMQYIWEGLLDPGEKKTGSGFDTNRFTRREKEVLTLICKQYTTHEIAEMLFISPRTVEGHRKNLLLKTGSKNVVGLVFYAIRNKLVPFEDKV